MFWNGESNIKIKQEFEMNTEEKRQMIKESFLANEEEGLFTRWRGGDFVYATAQEDCYMLTYCKQEEMVYNRDVFQTLDEMITDMMMVNDNHEAWRECHEEDNEDVKVGDA